MNGLFVVNGQTDTQDSLALTTQHRQHAMTGTALQRFFPFKVVAIFLCLVSVFLRLDHLRLDECLASESRTYLVAGPLIFADLFGNDVLSTFDSICCSGDVALDEAFGNLFRVGFTLHHQEGG